MNKFKVGDYIKGNQNAFYSITDEDMTRAKVIKILSDDDYEDDIRIKILKHKTKKEEIGRTFEVNSEYFTLIDSSPDFSSESTKITSDFKVGDIIRGTKRGTMYSFTNVNMIRGEVVEVHNPDIRIKILDQKSFRDSIGNVYTAKDGNVNNTFELIKRKAN
jgi:hypothetical protein